MDIKTMDFGAFNAYPAAMKHDQMCVQGGHAGTGNTFPQNVLVVWYHSKKSFSNYTGNNDPTYDAMSDSMALAKTEAEANKLMKDIDMYTLKQHWDIYTFPLNGYTIWQPYFKGYSGELLAQIQGAVWARLWIDKGP
jgi:ABC-type transport system substrate-binding protein